MSELLTQPMQEILDHVVGVEALLWMDPYGEVLASVGASAQKLTQLASFAKGVGDLSERLCIESGCGQVKMTLLQAEDGVIVIHQSDEMNALMALANHKSSLGTLTYDLDVCVKNLSSASRGQ